MKSVKIVYITIVAYILCFMQCYFSMQAYTKELSAFCLNCRFSSEILMTSLLMIFIFPAVWLIKVFKLNSNVKNIISSICFFMVLYMVNTNIFDSRVASWSSYSHTDVFISVFFLFYPYLLASILLFWVALRMLKIFASDIK